MTYEHSKTTVEGFTLVVESDDDYIGFGNYIGDEPIAVFSSGSYNRSHVMHDNVANYPSFGVCKAIYSEDYNEILCEYAFDVDTVNGKTRVEYWDKPRYFKNDKNAAKAVFYAECGFDLDEIGVTQAGNDRSSTYWVIWNKSEFKKYSGSVDSPSTEYVSDILDGNIWQHSIIDPNGEIVDACGGFVGEPEYCEVEGLSTLAWHVNNAKNQRTTKLKELIRNRVPLSMRANLLVNA